MVVHIRFEMSIVTSMLRALGAHTRFRQRCYGPLVAIGSCLFQRCKKYAKGSAKQVFPNTTVRDTFGEALHR